MNIIYSLLLTLIPITISYADCIKGESKCGVDGYTYICSRNSANTSVWQKNEKITEKCQAKPYVFSANEEINESCTEGDKKCNFKGTVYECLKGGLWLESLDKCTDTAMPQFGLAFSASRYPIDKVLESAKTLIKQGEYSKAEQVYLNALQPIENQYGAEQTVVKLLDGLVELYKSQGQFNKIKSLFSRSMNLQEKLLSDRLMLDVSNNLAETAPADKPSTPSISEAQEIDAIKSFIRSYSQQINSLTEAYKTELIAIGFDDVLNPDKLNNATLLNKSLTATQEAKNITRKFKNASQEKLDNALVEFQNLPLNEALKDKVGHEFAYAAHRWHAFNDAVWAIETKVITECETILQVFVDNKAHWQIKDKKLVFDDQKYLDTFNNHLANINALSKKEGEVISKSLQIFTERMQMALL